MLYDSHCHLEKFHQQGRLPEVLARAQQAGLEGLITVGTRPADWPLYHSLARAHPGLVEWTAGLHPGEVGEDWEEALTELPTWFADDPPPVALGEIGLDHFHLPAFPDEAAEVKARQLAAFRAQLEFASQFACPVVIHSRGAFRECVSVIDASGVDWRRVVFHCFVEGPEEIRELNRRGGRGSFTGILTYPNAANVRAALQAQGPELLLLETDAPYLTPVPHRGKPNEPAFLVHTAAAAAALLGLSQEDLAARTTAQTKAFFGR